MGMLIRGSKLHRGPDDSSFARYSVRRYSEERAQLASQRPHRGFREFLTRLRSDGTAA